MTHVSFRLAAAVVAAFALTVPAIAQSKWEPIGAITYGNRPVRDIVEIGARPGGFKSIRMEVRQSDVEILDLKVVYANGNAEDIRVREIFKAGSASRNIDLRGGPRQIRQIEVTYLPKGPARILFFGVAGAAEPRWEQLGCQSVGFHVDRDVIRVGRQEGRFSSIRLRIKDAPIELFDLRAVFPNGTRQDIRVRAIFRPGSESRPIDIAGKARGLDRVEVVYRSLPSFKGKAVLCVDGLQAP